MGILSSAFNFITSGSSQASKITDAVINTGDMLVYTKEEQAIDKAEDYKARRDMWLKMMELARDESSIKAITRRILSIAIIGHWLLFIDLAFVMFVFGDLLWSPLLNSASKAWDIAEVLLLPASGAGAFYYGVEWMRRKP